MMPGRGAILRTAAHVRILFACLLAGVAVMADARADAIAQGVLQLRWGDASRLPQAGVALPAQFEAWLEVAPGLRYLLDTEQARRAAGDLYALSNRRVAVSYRLPGSITTGGSIVPWLQVVPEIDAIVPADALPVRTMAKSEGGGGATPVQVAGSTRWITLMCRFADLATEQKPRSFFQAQYGNLPGQLGHYWSEVSYGRIDLAGSTAHGWYPLPRPRAAYLSLVNGRTRVDLSQLFADCTALADAEVDFHGAQGINLMFNGELDGSAWGGGACAVLDGGYRCTRVTWNPPWSFSNLAPLAHEMGHGYGLPHSDNSDGDADTYDNPWDLMSDAWRNATSDIIHGLLPKQLSMIQRERLGWVPAANRRTIAADNGETHDVLLAWADAVTPDGIQLLVLSLPAQPDPYRTVVYTLEARRRAGTYDAALAGDAVILHVLEDYGIARSIDTDQPAADLASNEGSMLKAGEVWRTPDERHGVEVVSLTASGFLVRVGPRPRAMSTPSPMLVRSNPVAVSSASVPAPVLVVDPAPRARVRRCDALPRLFRAAGVCAWLAR